MTPDEHKAEAERIIYAPGWDDPVNVARAQVHATLALVREPVELAEISTFEPEPYSLRLLSTGSVVRAYDVDQRITPRAETGQ